MVNYISSKDMFQNTEELVQMGTYKSVSHGTSVNVICYMANKESRGHNMETNQLQITTIIQFHITFTLPSITLHLCAAAAIGQQWPLTLLCYPLTS